VSGLDLSFVEEGRTLEVEAFEGGQASAEFTLDPMGWGDPEAEGDDDSVLGRAVDDILETQERLETVPGYLDYARAAFRQRGLGYPFRATAAKDSLEVIPGREEMAAACVALADAVSVGHRVAKDFEERAFRALQRLVGGWGVCVGTPRRDGSGRAAAVKRFRGLLRPWEQGGGEPEDADRGGDYGADGFLLLGRSWGGPILFYQAKNSPFALDVFPEELARIPNVVRPWFGRDVPSTRFVPVLALNTILTMETKDRIHEERGPVSVHVLDAVDILAAEHGTADETLRRPECIVL